MTKPIPSGGEAMPECRAATAAPSHMMTREEVEALTAQNLRCLHEALKLGADVLTGIICQPRFNKGKNHELNAAGAALDRIIEHLLLCAVHLLEEAKSRPMEDPDDVEERAWMVFTSELNNFGGLPDFAVLAASFAAEKSSADWTSARRRPA